VVAVRTTGVGFKKDLSFKVFTQDKLTLTSSSLLGNIILARKTTIEDNSISGRRCAYPMMFERIPAQPFRRNKVFFLGV